MLGDGSQSKSYIHVDDVVRAVLAAHTRTAAPFAAYNVATGDYITVREIAELAVECVGLAPGSVRFAYTGGDRGWKGDVPVVRLDTTPHPRARLALPPPLARGAARRRSTR